MTWRANGIGSGFLQTLLKCIVAASLTVVVAQVAGAAEPEHRHFTHEAMSKSRMLPANFHRGDAFAALDARKDAKAHFTGPGGTIAIRHSHMRDLSAQPHG
jgi:hypothetical protein